MEQDSAAPPALDALDVVLLGQPEVYFQNKPGLIGNEFEITDEGTRAFLEGWVSRFDAFIDRLHVFETDSCRLDVHAAEEIHFQNACAFQPVPLHNAA